MSRAGKIVADPSHPGHKLFEVLPSHYKTSFFPAAVGLINKARDPPPDMDSYPAPTPQVSRSNSCVTLTHITLHIALLFCTFLHRLHSSSTSYSVNIF